MFWVFKKLLILLSKMTNQFGFVISIHTQDLQCSIKEVHRNKEGFNSCFRKGAILRLIEIFKKYNLVFQPEFAEILPKYFLVPPNIKKLFDYFGHSFMESRIMGSIN